MQSRADFWCLKRVSPYRCHSNFKWIYTRCICSNRACGSIGRHSRGGPDAAESRSKGSIRRLAGHWHRLQAAPSAPKKLAHSFCLVLGDLILYANTLVYALTIAGSKRKSGWNINVEMKNDWKLLEKQEQTKIAQNVTNNTRRAVNLVRDVRAKEINNRNSK
jgi:hypothetical protein